MKHESGMSTLEFALVSLVFMAMVMLVLELSRLMFIHVTAAGATRMGARMAAVCGPQDDAIVEARMQQWLSLINAHNIAITYPAQGCSAQTCEPVRVRLESVSVRLNLPFAPLDVGLPSFSTTLPAESLDSTNNPLCK